MPSQEAIAFKDKIVNQLTQVAPVTARAMFGGYGLYADGVMFALIADETLYFKVGDENRADYLEADMGPFRYERHGQPIQMSYYQLPETVLEDPETLLSWIEKAQGAAHRSKKSKKSKKRKQS
ncbi:TfoX/Sxy family protein [Leptothoe spongobia]|uniref:TfoX/Sxy family protein n=1 Tax=Leptothoe spongobia TAU-MAC 1115 TaxID=1967444 RepID=A0A947GKN5_9CYAN|nr:TfoX/Sxy family protein [Leptothoe spongobia]MBT9317008.1 TfoX/Sxy family protein [Leptothoe spongobia TAU-MAC 1115]